jgi:hypothetical protein
MVKADRSGRAAIFVQHRRFQRGGRIEPCRAGVQGNRAGVFAGVKGGILRHLHQTVDIGRDILVRPGAQRIGQFRRRQMKGRQPRLVPGKGLRGGESLAILPATSGAKT